MKINTADFIVGAASAKQFPPETMPEIAFAGKSNVGKSSLINSLLHRKNLVKTSSTPGKTQQINFFLINQRFYFVDLPGYGFAKVPNSVKQSWAHLIESYLSERDALKGVVLIIDSRHGPNEGDRQLYEWLQHYQIPTVVVANKVDKLKKNQIIQQTKQIRLDFEMQEAPIAHSAINKVGQGELWKTLFPLLGVS